jgi:hypothetical protein
MIEQANAEAQKHSEKAAELAKQIEESKDRQRKMILDYRKKYGKDTRCQGSQETGMEPFKSTNASTVWNACHVRHGGAEDAVGIRLIC